MTDLMHVIKRDGVIQEISFDKIKVRISYLCGYKNTQYSLLPNVDVISITQSVIAKLYNNITTNELDEEAARIAQNLSFTHPDYGILASRITISNFHKNTLIAICQHFNIHKLTATESLYLYTNELLYNNKSSKTGLHAPLISTRLYKFIQQYHKLLEPIIDYTLDYNYDYIGFKMLEDKYLLRPIVNTYKGTNHICLERPQHMIMRITLGLVIEEEYSPKDVNSPLPTFESVKDKITELYTAMSHKYYTHATPTLYNAGTPKPQLASCFLLALNDDSIDGIMDFYKQSAIISKNAGGIGAHWHNIRSKGAYIKGTGGTSNGPIPFLKVCNELSLAVDQGGNKRPGSIAIYFEPWHLDIVDLLDLKLKEGNDRVRARELSYGLWIPDRFMRAVENDETWYLMCPNSAPGLSDVYGKQFDDLYTTYINEKRYSKTIPARELFHQIIKVQTETGMPYILYKDACNEKSNQRHYGTIKSSNLCVTGNTLILTDNGYLPIESLVDKSTNVWNGTEFSTTTIIKTGTNQPVIDIHFSDGSKLTCTKYHKFILPDETLIEAQYLQPQQQLLSFEFPKLKFDNPFEIIQQSYLSGKMIGYHLNTHNPTISIDTLNIEVPSDITPDIPYLVCDLDYYTTSQQILSLIKGLIEYNGYFTFYPNNTYSLTIPYIDYVNENTIVGHNESTLNKLKIKFQYIGLHCSLYHKNLVLPPNDTKTLFEYLNMSIDHIKQTFHQSRFIYTNANYNHVNLYVTKIDTSKQFSDTYCFNEPKLHRGVFNSVLTGNCSEIIEYSDEHETSVCTLASICLPKFIVHVNDANHINNNTDNNTDNTTTLTFDYKKLREITRLITWALNRVIDVNYYPVIQTKTSNDRHRPIGIGVQGLADVYAMLKMPFDSEAAREVNFQIFENIYYAALEESCSLSKEFGPYPTYKGSPISNGKLQFDLWTDSGFTLPFPLTLDWTPLRQQIQQYGVRNSLLVALMPTASTSNIVENNPCFEPYQSNIYLRENQSGEFIITNKHLVQDLILKNQWTLQIRRWIIARNGFLSDIMNDPDAPTTVKNIISPIADIYKTAFEIDPNSIVQQAHDRGFFVDQSQSMNLFFAHATPKLISNTLFKGWKLGLKTGSYYIRSRPAKDAIKFTIPGCDMCSS